MGLIPDTPRHGGGHLGDEEPAVRHDRRWPLAVVRRCLQPWRIVFPTGAKKASPPMTPAPIARATAPLK